eukprot:CAMPEP_0168621580 /NCGR_PEP_ID=MMETSP0449_2-20121227/7777_1 /TAXON_ID=1082188 /ORGANISM="Strombidium rassoulzadegani, Strain ras09" /LENGTH=59 /DNA_ID=CAMNT_0008662723 /DNA_START=46 /DNA_END=221 /DNA_ORIENTATION=+
MTLKQCPPSHPWSQHSSRFAIAPAQSWPGVRRRSLSAASTGGLRSGGAGRVRRRGGPDS